MNDKKTLFNLNGNATQLLLGYHNTLKYSIAGGNQEIINILKENGYSFEKYLETSVKYHRYELTTWLNENYKCEPVFLPYCIEFYNIDVVDKVIGTRFEFKEGKFIRKMLGNNCKGEEKVKRLKEVLSKENIKVDFKNSYMFSDSLSDKPLLDLVGKPYLINYKKKHEIEILKWI